MKNRLTLLLALFFCAVWALRISAQEITVDAGTTFTIGSGVVVTTNNLSSSGTVTNAGALNVSGNWSNTGTAAVAGTVNLSSDNLTVSGQTIFTNANLNDSSGAQQVVTDANAGSTPSDFGNLTVSSTNGASLGSNLYASQSLNLGNQLLTTNTYSMDLGAGATASNSTGYVLGNLQKAFNTGGQSFNFIVGTANGYSPVTVAFNNVTTAGNLTVNATQSFEPHPIVPTTTDELNRYWTLVAGGGLAFDNYSATLNYLAADFNGSPFAQATDEATMRGAAYTTGPIFPTVANRVYSDGATGSLQLTGLTAVGNLTTIIPCPGLTPPTAGNGSNCGPGTVTITATVSGGYTVNWYDSPTGGTLLATGTTSFTTPSISTTTIYYAETEDVPDGCESATRTAVTATINTCGGANTWLGNSTDWNSDANWSSGTPPSGLCSESVSIPTPGGTTQEPVLTGPESVGNLSLGSGASINLGRFNLDVCGNVTGGAGASDGDILGTGELVLNGSSLQQLSGKVEVQAIEINNTAGVQLQAGSELDIYYELDLVLGQLDATNGTVTLKSTSVTQAAIINDFSFGSPHGTYKGNVIAERFYGAASASNDFSQHMVGSPVGGIDLSALGSTNGSAAYYQPYTGNAPGTPDPNNQCDELLSAPGTPYGNVFSYVESHASSCTMAGWLVNAANTAASAGTGYSVVLGGGSGTFSLTGPPNLNTSYNVGATNSGYATTTSDQGRQYPSGINLVSNPYPAPLLISSLVADNPGFSSTVYVWQESTGSYYTPGVGNSDPAVIAPFQAFKVILGSPQETQSANYVINGTSRTITAGVFQRTANPIELSMTVTNNSTGLTDETTVGFNPASSAQFNPTYDLIKLPGALTRHTLYSLNSNNWMWMNILNSINETSTVPVGFEPGVSGTYTTNFGGLNSFDPTSYVMLEDKQTGTMFNVRDGEYTFTSDATTDSWNRFVLHFTPPAVIFTQDASCDALGMINIQQPGTANWNYTVTDANNVTIASGTLNAGTPVTVSANAGVYTLTLMDNNGYTVLKNIQIGGVQPVSSAFTASATTAQVQQNIIFDGTADNASVYNWDFGDGATSNGPQVTHSYQSEGIYTAKLTVTGAAGCISATSQTITVISKSATGITNLNGNNLNIWSYDNTVFVDFSKVANVDAEVQLYNVLGQMLSDERVGRPSLYSRGILNIGAAYIIVKVVNNGEIITRKVFISNADK